MIPPFLSQNAPLSSMVLRSEGTVGSDRISSSVAGRRFISPTEASGLFFTVQFLLSVPQGPLRTGGEWFLRIERSPTLPAAEIQTGDDIHIDCQGLRSSRHGSETLVIASSAPNIMNSVVY